MINIENKYIYLIFNFIKTILKCIIVGIFLIYFIFI